MRLFTEAVVAATVCIAAFAAVLALHPLRRTYIERENVGVFAILTAFGDAEALEQAARELIRCPGQGGIHYDLIMIADCGLSPAGRKTAELLANGDERIMLCTPDAIENAVLSEENRWTESVSTTR